MTEAINTSYSQSTDSNTYEDYSTLNETLLNKITQILNSVLAENKKLSNYKEKISSQKNMSFTSYDKPSVTINEYLVRIQKYSEAEDSTIIMGLMYVDRICEIAKIVLTPYNIHRLLFTAIFLAIKYNEDVVFSDTFYSRVSGIPIKELKQLELDFVLLVQFKLFIKKEEYQKYKVYIDRIEEEGGSKKIF